MHLPVQDCRQFEAHTISVTNVPCDTITANSSIFLGLFLYLLKAEVDHLEAPLIIHSAGAKSLKVLKDLDASRDFCGPRQFLQC